MFSQNRFLTIFLITLTAILLSACGNIQTVKSFSTQYQQPNSGDRAKIRVVAFNGMIRAVPNSNCIDWRLPGAGVMVVTSKGFAQVNNQKLEMPFGRFPDIKSTDTVAVSELYVPAGKPLSLYYLSYGSVSQNGQSITRKQCHVIKSFTPISGENYEATFSHENTVCPHDINQLKPDGGIDHTKKIELTNANLCRATDNL
jgi:hypothetical protein